MGPAEFELILYTIRMVLKSSCLPVSLARHDRRSRQDELDFLERRAQRSTVYQILDEHLPYLSRPLFDACLTCLRPRTSNWYRWRTRTRLQRALAAFARRPPLVAHCRKLKGLSSNCLRQLLRLPKARKHWVNGGGIIAVVVGDGAGKSTVISHLDEHYRRVVATRIIHVGRPTAAWTTWIVRLLLAGQRASRGLFLLRRSESSPCSRRFVTSAWPVIAVVPTRVSAVWQPRGRWSFVTAGRWPDYG